MNEINQTVFKCQFYVSARGHMSAMLPDESGPKKIITFVSVDYDQLIQPEFTRLLVALESIPTIPQFVKTI